MAVDPARRLAKTLQVIEVVNAAAVAMATAFTLGVWAGPPEELDFRGDTVVMPELGAGEVGPRIDDRPLREQGTPMTVFVNFDGVKIGECSPSNSKKNCHWLNDGTTFEAFSGSTQTKVGILQSMRALVQDYGIRVTGQRPPKSEDYAMVVYGGDADDYDAIGQAPGGDCGDEVPNQIAYVYLDGERNHWVNGGATTSLHEAAHTWGLDHVGRERTIMAPAGDNARVYFADECNPVVADVDLTPGEGSCPAENEDSCGDADQQLDHDRLVSMFGPPYVDQTPPLFHLVEPRGRYVQAPGDFMVELDVVDDLHPQVYELQVAIDGLLEDPDPMLSYGDSFEVQGLPVGVWTFRVSLWDEAGNEGTLVFDLEVGDAPPPSFDDQRGGCRVVPGFGPWWAAVPIVAIMALLARVRRRRGRLVES